MCREPATIRREWLFLLVGQREQGVATRVACMVDPFALQDEAGGTGLGMDGFAGEGMRVGGDHVQTHQHIHVHAKQVKVACAFQRFFLVRTTHRASGIGGEGIKGAAEDVELSLAKRAAAVRQLQPQFHLAVGIARIRGEHFPVALGAQTKRPHRLADATQVLQHANIGGKSRCGKLETGNVLGLRIEAAARERSRRMRGHGGFEKGRGRRGQIAHLLLVGCRRQGIGHQRFFSHRPQIGG